jgi:hypothetical protein
MSPAYQLHPEFGLLCPSRRFRRKVRLVFACLVVTGLLAWQAGQRPDTDSVSVVAHDDEARLTAEAGQAVGETTGITTADRSAALEGSKPACIEDAWSYFDGRCSAGTSRKLLRPRAANEAPTIATLPLGRSAVPPPVSSGGLLSATAQDSTKQGSTKQGIIRHVTVKQVTAKQDTTEQDTTESTPAVADRPAAPASKKVKKPSPRNTGDDVWRDRRWRDEQWGARAYAYPDDRYLRGRYERSWGWGWNQYR